MDEQQTELTGRVVYPTNVREYNKARQNNNGRFDLFPRAIVYCQNEQDVINAVRWAKEHKSALRVRSGGHNYEALSNATNALVIDLSEMNRITVDEHGAAWIESGAKLGDVYETLDRMGLTIPGGTCPWVRVGGLTQGGGVGFLHRKMGLTCDSLTAVRIVTADGRLRTVMAGTEDEELLWALRGGGGGNFGVVTSLQFQTHAVKEKVTVFSLIWHDKDMTAIAKKWCAWSWTPEADRRLTTFLRLYAPEQLLGVTPDLGPPPKEATLIGVFLGTEEEAKAALRPLTEVAKTESAVYRYVSYGDAVKIWSGLLYGDEERPDRFLVHLGFETTEGQEWYKISSAFAGEHFQEEAVEKMVEYLHQNPANNHFVSLHALGGKVADLKVGETAFAFRDQKFILQYQAFWTPVEDDQEETRNRQAEGIQWIKNFRATMAPYTTGAFINFVDVDVKTEDYYKGNFHKLVDVKKKYDPNHLFNFPVSL